MGIRDKLQGEVLTSDHLVGRLCEAWAEAPWSACRDTIPVGAFDMHWDAIGAGCREGDVVNVVGTSTCVIAMQRALTRIPEVCGVVQGSVHHIMPAWKPASLPPATSSRRSRDAPAPMCREFGFVTARLRLRLGRAIQSVRATRSDAETQLPQFRHELTWNEAAFRLG